jgi:hypothetical protein
VRGILEYPYPTTSLISHPIFNESTVLGFLKVFYYHKKE